MRRLLAHLGNPQERLRVVHVAGTSGKTSTAYYVRALLEASGQRTGLTVSPHIVAINERVQVDGVPMPEEPFVLYVNAFLARIAEYPERPTYFELVVALAFWAFAAEQVDYAVVEVGIGGLRDGTNVVERADKVCAIGPIGLDHTEVLGPTLLEIAAHKAGIIGPGNLAVVLEQGPDVLDVVRARVRDVGAWLRVVGASETPLHNPGGAAAFQDANFAVALAVVQELAARDGFDLPHDAVVEELRAVAPPARYERFAGEGKRLILDGAHNPQKMAGLVSALAADGLDDLAVLATVTKAPAHKLADTLAVLAPRVGHLIVTDYVLGGGGKVKRSFPADAVAAAARGLGMSVEVVGSLTEGIAALLERPEPELLITGSLYLASLARPELLDRLHAVGPDWATPRRA